MTNKLLFDAAFADNVPEHIKKKALKKAFEEKPKSAEDALYLAYYLLHETGLKEIDGDTIQKGLHNLFGFLATLAKVERIIYRKEAD